MLSELSRLIDASALSKSAIARRAGLSPSTITRMASGQLDPSLGTAQAVLNALGFQLPDSFPPLCDSEAARTARRLILGEATSSPWVEILERWAGNLPDLVLEAGRASPISQRPETVTIKTSWSPLRIYGAVAATGSHWVASGWSAGAMHGTSEEPEHPLVIYVDGGANAVGLGLPHDAHGNRTVQILPFDGVSEQGAQNAEGIIWADPYQVSIDLCANMETEHLGLQLINGLEKRRV